MSLFGPANATSSRDCTLRRTKDWKMLKHYVREWHSTLPSSPAGMRVGFLVYAPNLTPVAVAMWGRPTARNEDQEETLELTRLAHSPDAPYNLGSWSLARMRKWIRQNMPEIKRIISYQDADVHDGAIYKADNWQQAYDIQEMSSSWTNRARRKGTERSHRIKWEREP